MKPDSIKQISDQVLVLKWDNGKESLLFANNLRKNCPCATCREKGEEKGSSPFNILKSNPENVVFIHWEFVGNYAVRFSFSDNHDTGIYTYDYLLEIGE